MVHNKKKLTMVGRPQPRIETYGENPEGSQGSFWAGELLMMMMMMNKYLVDWNNSGDEPMTIAEEKKSDGESTMIKYYLRADKFQPVRYYMRDSKILLVWKYTDHY